MLYAYFSEYEEGFSGHTINFTVAVISSSPPVINSDWSRFHAPLNDSKRVFISNFTSGGIQYSSIAIHDLSVSDDGGNYSYCASNGCGKSCVYVFLDVIRGMCVYVRVDV